jgi:hypothetical protein
MTTSDTRPTSADHLLPALVRGCVGALALAVVWFACGVIAPRHEASLMDAGLRPSPAVRGLLVATHYFVRYFWWIAPILVGFLVISAKARPGLPGAGPR